MGFNGKSTLYALYNGYSMTVKITEAIVNNLKSNSKEYDIRDVELKGFLVRVQKFGNASYVLAYKNQAGQSRRYKIGTVGEITAARARKLASELKLEVASRKDPNAEKQKQREKVDRLKKSTFKAFFTKRYQQYAKTHHKQPRGTIERLSKFVQRWGDLSLMEIDLKMLHAYQAERLDDGVANSTINRELNCVRGLFRLAEEESVISSNPFRKLKPLKIDKKPKTRFLDSSEEKRLISELVSRQNRMISERQNANKWREERHYELMQDTSGYKYSNYLMPLVQIALKTGLRRSELLSLRWIDVIFDENNSSIYVQGINTKNSQSRIIPLNDEAVSILKEWKLFCDDSDINSEFVFPNPVSGERMTEIGSAWSRVLESAKINNFRFHDLRHTFASKLAKNGVDLNTIRELMGHADITMTLRYAHLSPGHLRNAVEGI